MTRIRPAEEGRHLAMPAFFAGLLVLTFVQTLVAEAAPPPAPFGKRWTMVWNDEFNTGTLDGSKWRLRGEARRATRNHGGLPVMWRYEDDNIGFEDGKLVLRNTREDDGLGTYLVKAAAIDSRGKFEQTYGYFEARIRIAPTADGVHTAFWLQNDQRDRTSANGGLDGPADGAEIDILESVYTNNRYGFAVHWDAGRTIGRAVPFNGIHDGRFHVYGVKWLPDGYGFFADDRRMARVPNGVSQSDGYVVLSTGLSWASGNARTGTFPNEALVDWVRVYELRDDPAINFPPAGAPSVSGTARVGQTLVATADGIDDEDGLGDPDFAWQWLAGTDAAYAVIEGAAGPSYTLTPAEAGKMLWARVSFTDDGGTRETLTSSATSVVAPADPSRAPPMLASARVAGSRLTLVFSEALDETSVPGPDAFSVTVGSGAREVSGVSVNGSNARLTLASAVDGSERNTASMSVSVT